MKFDKPLIAISSWNWNQKLEGGATSEPKTERLMEHSTPEESEISKDSKLKLHHDVTKYNDLLGSGNEDISFLLGSDKKEQSSFKRLLGHEGTVLEHLGVDVLEGKEKMKFIQASDINLMGY